MKSYRVAYPARFELLVVALLTEDECRRENIRDTRKEFEEIIASYVRQIPQWNGVYIDRVFAKDEDDYWRSVLDDGLYNGYTTNYTIKTDGDSGLSIILITVRGYRNNAIAVLGHEMIHAILTLMDHHHLDGHESTAYLMQEVLEYFSDAKVKDLAVLGGPGRNDPVKPDPEP